MTLVNQYQQGTLTAPINGDVNDASVVVANDNAIIGKHNSHDADATIHLQTSTLAGRPAATTLGRNWLSNDGLRGYYDNGSAWTEWNYVPVISGIATTSSTLKVGTVTQIRAGASTAVAAGPTTIDTALYSGVTRVVVIGTEPTPHRFCDVVCFCAPASVVVVSSTTVTGAPAARTYTVTAGGLLQLAMASGLYTVRTAPTEL